MIPNCPRNNTKVLRALSSLPQQSPKCFSGFILHSFPTGCSPDPPRSHSPHPSDTSECLYLLPPSTWKALKGLLCQLSVLTTLSSSKVQLRFCLVHEALPKFPVGISKAGSKLLWGRASLSRMKSYAL